MNFEGYDIDMVNGGTIHVPRGVSAERPFLLMFDHTSKDCNPRASITLEEGAQAEVIIFHRQADDAPVHVDFMREAVVGRDARLSLSEITQMGAQSTLAISGNVSQHACSRTEMMNVWLHGGKTKVDIEVNLAESHAEANLYGLWFAAGTGDLAERTDINVRALHIAPDCTSFQLVKGIAAGEAVGKFTGLIHVAADARRTAAQQQSRNLLMSETARIYTEPRLEIYSDDVKCSHGATVGQLDESALFYMRQRGLSEDDARRLQMSGFVNDIISRCPHDGVCDFVYALAEERIKEL
ncbi:MAG: SufD family Fe-S cluster assembly protein [Rikenellaceae bacterium]|nr:SufD family Fe-S cluster assembly protein [Rikenellaceae bacterium]MCL2692024.1 SufD family Fe-S cluster assembly protein [Rikenellaceae bacterium]